MTKKTGFVKLSHGCDIADFHQKPGTAPQQVAIFIADPIRTYNGAHTNSSSSVWHRNRRKTQVFQILTPFLVNSMLLPIAKYQSTKKQRTNCQNMLRTGSRVAHPVKGLLKVAIDNARAQEKQIQMEKTELKMELFRERELRETIEKQLAVEQKNRAIIQKRLKKEKKAKRKLQEALEYETKRRDQAEQTLKQAASTDSLRALNESLTQEMETDHGSGRTDAERTIQELT
ncbi:UNVERIFIED_CONTAM: hypothetical protein FKN15_066082 [Acipenser sinensis]